MFADDEYTFEAFILIKEEKVLKKFVLYEGSPSKRNDTHINFKKKIQYVIANAIIEKFANEAVEYDIVNNIADNQKKFTAFPQLMNIVHSLRYPHQRTIRIFTVQPKDSMPRAFFSDMNVGIKRSGHFNIFGLMQFLTGKAERFISYQKMMSLLNFQILF